MNCHSIKRTAVSRALACALALGLPAAALAQSTTTTAAANPNAGSRSANNSIADAHFRLFDTNHDGYVSRQEFAAREGDLASVPASTPSTPADGSSVARSLSGNFYASNLIGMNVRNSAGRDVGEIEDLLVDVDSGKIRSAIVSFGGFAGIGDKLYRYPLSSFSGTAKANALTLNVDDQSVRAAKGFDRSNWNPGDDAQGSSKAQGVWQASRLLGRDIEDRNDDHLGEIQDLAIDGRTGQVQYAIMRYDRPWSLDNPLVAVPLRSLRFAGDKQTISMNVDRNEVDTQRMAGVSASPDLWIERWFVLLPDTTGAAGRNTSNVAATNANAGTGGQSNTTGNVSTSGSATVTSGSGNGAGSASNATVSRGSASGSMTGAAAAPSAGSATASAPGASEFSRLDTNHDGTLSQAEYEAGSGGHPAFSSADKDSSNSISRAEFSTMRGTTQ